MKSADVPGRAGMCAVACDASGCSETRVPYSSLQVSQQCPQGIEEGGKSSEEMFHRESGVRLGRFRE